MPAEVTKTILKEDLKTKPYAEEVKIPEHSYETVLAYYGADYAQSFMQAVKNPVPKNQKFVLGSQQMAQQLTRNFE